MEARKNLSQYLPAGLGILDLDDLGVIFKNVSEAQTS